MKSSPSAAKASSPLDENIGAQLRRARELRRVSLAELAQSIGVALQQIQKYETGENRISASRLQQVSAALNVPVSFFFSEMVDADALDAQAECSAMVLEDLSPVKARLIRTIMRLEDRTLETLSSLLRQLADANHERTTNRSQTVAPAKGRDDRKARRPARR